MKTPAHIALLVLVCQLGMGGVANGQTLDTSHANCNSDAALSVCLTPKFSKDYYECQGIKYFETMQSNIGIGVQPHYSPLVVRWEWPPWLLLTGITKAGLIATDIMLKLTPTSYDKMECKAFDTQPFCRCHVVFNYSGKQVPIYEEFTFNNQGQMTFIEAWSDYPSLLPMGPGQEGIWDEQDYWAMHGANRLSTKLPGLGNATGLIDFASPAMQQAAKENKDIADLVDRAQHPTLSWLKQLKQHSKELQSGLTMPKGDVYPYYAP